MATGKIDHPISNENISKPIFENKLLDRLTRTHIAVPVSCFFIYAAALLYYTKTATSLGNLQVVGLFFGGWLFFTWAEWQIHKRLYHMKLKSEKAQDLAYKFHGIHHEYPKDKKRLAMPPVASISIATILLFLFELVLDIYSFSFLAGFLVGYAMYLLVHYTVHIFRPPNNFLKALWTFHAIHHYQNPEILFGVSSPLWDYVYGTLPDKKEKKAVEVRVDGKPV
jgi:sterol desaturase/sphingolipid hydroxylase (fatty acid hydroxylase superfamily)